MFKNTYLTALLVAAVAIISLISCEPSPTEISYEDIEDTSDETGGVGGDGGAGGAGEISIESCSTKTDWIKVKNVAELKAIGKSAESMAKNYCLTANIDLMDETNDFPLGWLSRHNILPFTGNLDGNHKTIFNLVVDKENDRYMGLFSKIEVATGGVSSSIKNLYLDRFSVKGQKYVGALAGEVVGKVIISRIMVTDIDISSTSVESGDVGGLLGKIKDGVRVSNSSMIGIKVIGQGDYVGGLVGQVYGSVVFNTHADGSVSGNNYVGGLIGFVSGSTVSHVYTTGFVKGDHAVGGVAGGLFHHSLLSNSYDIGAVNGVDQVGGLVGHVRDSEIWDSHADGSVTGHAFVGGLVGEAFDFTLTNSYTGSFVTGYSFVGGLAGYFVGGKVTKSHADGFVTTTPGGFQVGGLVGYMHGDELSNSYSTGKVTGGSDIGGLVGFFVEDGEILNCYASGKVIATDDNSVKGGLIGSASEDCTATNCVVTNSYFNESANSGMADIGKHRGITKITGLVGVDGKGDIVSKNNKFYTASSDVEIFVNWQNDIWEIVIKKWPLLKAQPARGYDDGLGGSNISGGAEEPNKTCLHDDWKAIYDVAGLKSIGESSSNMAKDYCLTADIDLSSVDSGFPLGWDPIIANIIPFTGNFDGGGYTISNLVIDKGNDNHIGLFADIGSSKGDTTSTIKDLMLKDFNIKGLSNVGSLAGFTKGIITISKIIAKNVAIKGLSSNRALVGGLIGSTNKEVKIIDSSMIGGSATSPGIYVGGFVGSMYDGSSIYYSYATNSVKGKIDVGGLVGIIYRGGKISNSYANGSVIGETQLGGLVGEISTSGEILNSYAIGEISIIIGKPLSISDPVKGGLVGAFYGCDKTTCKIADSYFGGLGNEGISAVGSNANIATIIGALNVPRADSIESRDGIFHLRNSSVVIFVEWNRYKAIWHIVEGSWPTFNPR